MKSFTGCLACTYLFITAYIVCYFNI